MPDPQVLAILRSLELLGERTIKKITLDITANLIESTPVDLGWARANWIPSVTKSVNETDGSPDQVSTAKQSAGQSQVATYKLRQGSVFVTNNVPYILRLNDGSSSQAPAGFVEAAVMKAVKRDILGLGT